MSRRLNRVWLLLVCLFTGEVWALGLGDIRLDSALNEPLRADIQLISATPDELSNLTVSIASAETFQRYGIHRPLFMSNIQFAVVLSGRTDGNVVRITTADPVTEPFLTFLVEAVWSRGRLLREYTVLLDPPTFAPPPARQAPQTVTAPRRTTPADSGQVARTPRPETQQPTPRLETQQPTPTPRLETQQPTPTPRLETQQPTPTPRLETQQPTPTPRPSPPAELPVQPAPSVVAETRPAPEFDDSPVGDFNVQRGDTLWGIARRVREDNRLTINQMMLAIYEANPQAFQGNINRLSAGATLRIPTAGQIFRISRGDALSEVQRQHDVWGGVPGVGISQPEPTLTLLAPDDDSLTTDPGGLYDADDQASAAADAQAATDTRIVNVRGLILDHQDGLIEIDDNELAALRAELVELTGEALPPELLADVPDLVIDDEPVDTDIFVDESVDGPVVDDDVTTDTDTDAATADTTPAPVIVSSPTRDEPGLVATIINAVTGIWGLIGAALLVVAGVLVWFARRAAQSDDEESTGMWEALDAEETESKSEPTDTTTRLRTMIRDDDSAMVVVEEAALPETDIIESETMEMPAVEPEPPEVEEVAEIADIDVDTGTGESLEDTFSSDTAINLDQSDPVAEADFHMAYGLYDQAADLINGALEVEPERRDLLTKLCEIYFVWGNRDAFVDAATRLKNESTDDADSEWDKIVIMGQQIAGDHEMFADAKLAGATRAVDLSFEDDAEETSALDMDFAVESAISDDDDQGLGAAAGSAGAADSIDFDFDAPDPETSVTQEMPAVDGDVTEELPKGDSLEAAFDDVTVSADTDESTLETPAAEDSSDSPTIEQQLASTSEMQAIDSDDATEVASLDDQATRDATAEIDLDDLGLDLDSLAESSALDEEGDFLTDLDDTAESQTLKIDDSLIATGRNLSLGEDDLDVTGQNVALEEEGEIEATGMHKLPDIDPDVAETGEMPTIEEVTGRNPTLPDADLIDTDVGLDTSLLDATGQTQVLPDDFVVETGTGTNIEKALAEDEATMLASLDDEDDKPLADNAATLLASLDDDEGEFDYAKTEALPKGAFSDDMSADETGVMPGLAAGSTDLDLDLDDLTAALKVSEVGDTVEQIRDDATLEQPRPSAIEDSDADDEDSSPTAAIAPEDLSGDLHDARTMTEVGTKLDLARAYVDMGDPSGARSILDEVLAEGDEAQRQQAQQILESLPS